MRYLYKSVRVIYDAHLKEYQVYYRTWFRWKYDTCYKWDEKPTQPIHYCTKEEAEKRAISRAEGMLKTVEIWRRSNIGYYG